MFLNRCLSNEKNTFADNSRDEPTIFFMEKQLFSLKLLSGDFYGQSFIKTVRGPSDSNSKLSLNNLKINHRSYYKLPNSGF